MRKKEILFIFLVASFLFNIKNVFAISYQEMEEKTKSNYDAVLLCEWNHGGSSIRLYRDYSAEGAGGFNYGLYYNNGGGYVKKAYGYPTEIIDIAETLTHSSINFYTYNESSKKFEIIEEGGYYNNSLFTCSRFVRLLNIGSSDKNMIDMLDTTDFDSSSGLLYAFDENANTIYNKFVSTAASQFDKIITIESLKKIDSIEDYIWEQTKKEYQNATNVANLYDFFDYLRINNHHTFSYTFINQNLVDKFNDFKTRMLTVMDESNLSDSVKQDLYKKITDYEKELPKLENDKNNENDDEKPLDTFKNNCKDFAKQLRIGGYLLMLVKIIIPLIIIIKATIKITGVAISNDPKSINKNVNNLIMSIVAGVVIFLIPTILNIFFNLISKYNDNITEDSKICTACIFEPSGSTCSSALE